MTARSCAGCGAPAPPVYRPPPAEGAPDLDMRPGEPTRSTLRRWLQTCRRCGATAPDLADLPPGAAEAVRRERYRAIGSSTAAAPFLRWALLCEGAGRERDAAEAALQGAWALDDADDAPGAARLRLDAGRLWGAPSDAADALRLIDVWRRAGDFRAARIFATQLASQILDESSERVLEFQQARIAEADDGRYLLSSALRPPARTPHVASRPAGREPLWRRLLGR